MWWVETLEIAGPNGEHTGQWRKVASSDEGGGIHGDTSHSHPSKEAAQACDICAAFCDSITGIPSRTQQAQLEEQERKEFELLSLKSTAAAPTSIVAGSSIALTVAEIRDLAITIGLYVEDEDETEEEDTDFLATQYTLSRTCEGLLTVAPALPATDKSHDTGGTEVQK